jgi:4-hydroxy-3-polyprenylbenzoate decarboxylase
LDELACAGFLNGEALQVVGCRTSGLPVPAGAEVVIEGYIEPGETRRGGLFGNHTGFYTPGGDVPVLRVAAISRKRSPLIPATVVGRPPAEDCYLAKAMERLLLPLTRLHLPEVEEINLPMEGIFHGSAVVSIRKRAPGDGRLAIERLWSCGWLSGSRLIVVVDADVDPHDLSASSWRVFNNVDWRRDTIVADAAAPRGLPYGGRLGIDATRKLPGELGFEPQREIGMTPQVEDLVSRRWREYGLQDICLM